MNSGATAPLRYQNLKTVAGYVFLYHKCRWGGLAGQNIPGVVDLIVFEKYRRMHIRAGIQADMAEESAKRLDIKDIL